jgi:hypothetical protein
MQSRRQVSKINGVENLNMLEEFLYKVEPTVADSPSQNGQVERYNNTIATVIHTLQYGANLLARNLSVAAVHAVYLMN